MKTLIFMFWFLLLCTLLNAISGCACEHATPVDRNTIERERAAACAAVPGCDRSYLDALSVYETDFAHIADYCEPGAVACYCTRPGCAQITLYTCKTDACRANLPETRVHEYVHAAYDSIGVDTHDHGPNFQAAMLRAQMLYSRAKPTQ